MSGRETARKTAAAREEKVEGMTGSVVLGRKNTEDHCDLLNTSNCSPESVVSWYGRVDVDVDKSIMATNVRGW